MRVPRSGVQRQVNKPLSSLARSARVGVRLMTIRLTMGRQRQTFAGARWIARAVGWCPRPFRRALALRVLALSPHYFFRRFNPSFAATGARDFRLAEFRRNRDSRRRLFQQVIQPFVPAGSRVLDYGCGAGFLAAAAADTMDVYAVDIAEGVLACAAVLNEHPSVRYLPADDRGFGRIPDGGIDAAWLIAVTQHLTSDELDRVVARCAAKIRGDGLLLMHAAIDRAGWWSEDEWRGDQTPGGRLAFEYSLNCFRRDEAFFVRALLAHGFVVERVLPIESLCGGDLFDDLCRDHLIVARRDPRA